MFVIGLLKKTRYELFAQGIAKGVEPTKAAMEFTLYVGCFERAPWSGVPDFQTRQHQITPTVGVLSANTAPSVQIDPVPTRTNSGHKLGTTEANKSKPVPTVPSCPEFLNPGGAENTFEGGRTRPGTYGATRYQKRIYSRP